MPSSSPSSTSTRVTSGRSVPASRRRLAPQFGLSHERVSPCAVSSRGRRREERLAVVDDQAAQWTLSKLPDSTGRRNPASTTPASPVSRLSDVPLPAQTLERADLRCFAIRKVAPPGLVIAESRGLPMTELPRASAAASAGSRSARSTTSRSTSGTGGSVTSSPSGSAINANIFPVVLGGVIVFLGLDFVWACVAIVLGIVIGQCARRASTPSRDRGSACRR